MIAKITKQSMLMDEAKNQISDYQPFRLSKVTRISTVTPTAEIFDCKLGKTRLFWDYQNIRLKCEAVNVNIWTSTYSC